MKSIIRECLLTILFLLTILLFSEVEVFGNSGGSAADPNYTAYLDDIVVTPSGNEESIFESFRSITVADNWILSTIE